MALDERQIIQYAAKLKSFLLAHDLATSQLQLIDAQVNQLTQRLFNSDLDGSQGQSLHLLTRKSVVDGIQKVFKQLKQAKFQKIQELSNLIMQQLMPEEEVTSVLSLDSMIGHQNDQDGLAPVMTQSFCLASRSM